MADAQPIPMENTLILPGPRPATRRRRLRSLLAKTLATAKHTVFGLYLYCGYTQLRDWLLSRAGRARIVVLYYHRVGGCDVLSKPEDEFRRDLQYLKKHFDCISLSALHRRLRGDRPIRRPIAVVTFDDGYRDNFTRAVPVLLAEKVPATFFVSTGFIDRDRDFPHDLRAAQGRDAASAMPHYPKLTWDDLRAMEAAGFEIGSHTVNHANLGRADEAAIARELIDSLVDLGRKLGVRPRAFSFPWGKPADISATALRIARQVGYYAVASAYGGRNRPGADPFHIRRVDAGNGRLGRLAFRARIMGFDPDYLRRKLQLEELR